ncbi:MAG: sulfotransferase [Anaerolineales bacterium]|nr:sulfotransferase [Anaerolineales bacterium]
MTASRINQGHVDLFDDRFWTSGVFICGHPKSGTSLLMTMLDSHPELIVYPEESHFFRRFRPACGAHPEKNIEEIVREYLLHIFEWNRDDPPGHQEGFADRDYSSIDSDRVRDLFRESIRQREGGSEIALPAAMFSYGSATGQVSDQTKYWVEKTPYNEQYAEDIFRYWPNSKCLHIVRDPRDNYASYKRKQTDWQPEHFSYSWWRSLRYGQNNVERFGSARYLLIRYEDLVEEPEKAINEIILCLGIDDDPILRRPTRAGRVWMGNSMFGDQFRSISAKPAGRYLEYLNRDEIRTLESLLRPEMQELGYSLDTAPSYPGYFVSQAKRIKWRLQG